MPERYTPTTAQVCAAYVAACGEYRDLAEGWFCRWLNEQLAKAWREGAWHGWCNYREPLTSTVYDSNPYETKENQ